MIQDAPPRRPLQVEEETSLDGVESPDVGDLSTLAGGEVNHAEPGRPEIDSGAPGYEVRGHKGYGSC